MKQSQKNSSLQAEIGIVGLIYRNMFRFYLFYVCNKLQNRNRNYYRDNAEDNAKCALYCGFSDTLNYWRNVISSGMQNISLLP